MQDDIDKRTEPRIYAGGSVRYKIMDEIEGTLIRGFCTGKIVNISLIGLAMESLTRLQRGAVIEIDLNPNKPGKRAVKSAHAVCKVQWQKEVSAGMYETGLDFIIISEEDIQLIKRFYSL